MSRLRFLFRVHEAREASRDVVVEVKDRFTYTLIPEMSEGVERHGNGVRVQVANGAILVTSPEPLVLYPGKKFLLEEAISEQPE